MNKVLTLARYFKIKSIDGVQAILNQICKRGDKEKVDAQIVDFFYTSVIPFNVIRNPTFAKMCDMISKCGVDYRPLSYHNSRDKLLKQAVDKIDIPFQKYRDE